MIDGLLEVLALKALDRAGWKRVGVAGPESVAAHSWGVAWLVVALCPPHLDRARALTYAVIHDLAEVRVGDLTPADGVAPEEKARREAVAMSELAASFPQVRADWARYEAQEDEESRFVRQLDRLDMALQAVAYHQAGAAGMSEFLASAERFVTDPALVPLLVALRARISDG